MREWVTKHIEKIVPAVAALGAIALMIVMISCHRKSKSEAETTPTIEVTEPVVDSVVLTKSYPGTLAANDWANVVGRVNGILIRRYYAEGDYVKKGQLLMSIESTKYVDAVKQAQAELETARSQYDYYSKQYEAMKKALESDAVSKMDVIQAKASMEQAQASMLNATADLSIARTNLGYCQVTAPLSGYITSSSLNPGAYINGESGEAILATIVDNSSFSAVFQIEDAQYEKMLGVDGGISNKAYRNVELDFSTPLPHKYTANMNFEGPTVSQTTGTLTLKGILDNPYNELKDGMYLTVKLPYGFDPKAVMVRESAISTDQLGKYLYVVNDSNKVVYTPIEVGEIYADTLRIIKKGIKPGERYVTKALLTVRPGMKVNPKTVK